MEKRDYLLREIEKIGLLLRSILNRIIGREENLAITIETQFGETKDMLFNEIGFDFDKFIALDQSASKDYIHQFKGFNSVNLELLAEYLYAIGVNLKPDQKQVFLKKALELYELCNQTDKTFSFEREAKIKEIENDLLSTM